MLRLTNAFSLGRRRGEECAGTLCSTPARARLWAECLAVQEGTQVTPASGFGTLLGPMMPPPLQ